MKKRKENFLFGSLQLWFKSKQLLNHSPTTSFSTMAAHSLKNPSTETVCRRIYCYRLYKHIFCFISSPYTRNNHSFIHLPSFLPSLKTRNPSLRIFFTGRSIYLLNSISVFHFPTEAADHRFSRNFQLPLYSFYYIQSANYYWNQHKYHVNYSL